MVIWLCDWASSPSGGRRGLRTVQWPRIRGFVLQFVVDKLAAQAPIEGDATKLIHSGFWTQFCAWVVQDPVREREFIQAVPESWRCKNSLYGSCADEWYVFIPERECCLLVLSVTSTPYMNSIHGTGWARLTQNSYDSISRWVELGSYFLFLQEQIKDISSRTSCEHSVNSA